MNRINKIEIVAAFAFAALSLCTGLVLVLESFNILQICISGSLFFLAYAILHDAIKGYRSLKK